jgi:hypothetical protein
VVVTRQVQASTTVRGDIHQITLIGKTALKYFEDGWIVFDY